jgi:biopolymer transport protein ExbD
MARRLKEDPAPGVVLPITPMLDMTFQIFAFFIMTFHPAALEGQMEMTLPAAGEAKAKDISTVDPTKPSDADLELPSEVTVMVRTVRDGVNDGAISQIVVQQLEGETPVNDLAGLKRHLEKIRTGLKNQDDIKIQADSKLKYAFVVEVMDTCIKAGFARVGFAPPPDLAMSGG